MVDHLFMQALGGGITSLNVGQTCEREKMKIVADTVYGVSNIWNSNTPCPAVSNSSSLYDFP